MFGLLFLYAYMLKMRSKYYAKTGGFVNSLLNRGDAQKEKQESQAQSMYPKND